jgi:hypothetical protein
MRQLSKQKNFSLKHSKQNKTKLNKLPLINHLILPYTIMDNNALQWSCWAVRLCNHHSPPSLSLSNQSNKRKIITELPNGYISPFCKTKKTHTVTQSTHTHTHQKECTNSDPRIPLYLSLSLTSFPFGPFVSEK